MNTTSEDILLQQSFKDRVVQYRNLIQNGQPYVWKLRLSYSEYDTLKKGISKSISSHHGDYKHLLEKEYALYLIIYYAEWYKRVYCGQVTGEDAHVVQLSTAERIKLWENSGIDTQTFVYNASNNPDRKSQRWEDSMLILGGLAVRDELRKEDNTFLLRLCKIYHGEDVDLSEEEDYGRAVAFQQSITTKHSLYNYVNDILKGDYPFAESDLQEPDSDVQKLITRIKNADGLAKKDKFEFEWLISYTAYYKQMIRRLKIRLKPEEVGGKYRQYVSYSRLREQWEIENPESIGRLMFDLRFKDGRKVVSDATFKDPILTFLNTGSEDTGFVAVDDVENLIYTHVPISRFTSVELVVKYDGKVKGLPESLDCSKEYVQVYKVANANGLWSDRKRPQAETAVIFSSRYKMKDEDMESQITKIPFRGKDGVSEDMSWCPIYETVTLIDERNHEITFKNCNGFYQVLTKKYINTIKYEDCIYVTYEYIDLNEDDDGQEIDTDDYLKEQLPLLFGREGLEIRKYKNKDSQKYNLVRTFDLEYKGTDGRYIDWNTKEPCQGRLHLRITTSDDMVYKTKVYYVPYLHTNDKPYPIWRDFEHSKICFAVDGEEDIKDDVKKGTDNIEETLKVKIGPDKGHVLIDVYRPVLMKELYQNGHLIDYYTGNDTIDIPLLICDQFTIRDFNEDGVSEFDCSKLKDAYYKFFDFHAINPNTNCFYDKIEAVEINTELPLEHLKVYLTKSGNTEGNRYEWDYNSNPKKQEDGRATIAKGVVFQSLLDNKSPRHYESIKEIGADDFWDDDDNENNSLPDVDCFKIISRHSTYFFLFKPMRKVVCEETMIQNIIIPLLKERQGCLPDDEINDLYRFALEFHFDWMLLPREKWLQAIDNVATDGDDKIRYQEWISDFFLKTPKCTDSEEHKNLKEFLDRYWDFNVFKTDDKIAIKALKSILNEPNVLRGNEKWEDFLQQYDCCRYKFSEMSRIYINNR